MKDSLLNNLDLVIASGMILLGILVLILSRLKLMPGRGIPFILAAILGVVGVTVINLNRAKAKRLKKDMTRLEEQIAARKREIEAATCDLERRDEILKQADREYRESLKNHKRHAVSYHVKSRDAFESMSDEEIFAAFDKIGT
jgi:tRNA(Ser,Leu) C12 N-acetylase TAN1